jgi:hypothetical protein
MRLVYLITLLPVLAFAADETSPIIVMDTSNKLVEKPLESAYPAPRTPAAPAPAPAPSDAIVQQFPGWAISNAGANSTGETLDAAPASPTSPTVPGAPTSVVSPASPQPAISPAPPGLATDPLWPKDTIPIFMKSCTGFKPELTAPCMCIITKLMVTMPHNEFIQLSEANTIESDKRLADIRQSCLGAPAKRE